MSKIKKFPRRLSGVTSLEGPPASIVSLQDKINEGIETRLGQYVNQVLEAKSKAKKAKAYQDACRRLGNPKKNKPKKPSNP